MGTKCAPKYANIFMGVFEEKHIYPKIQNKIRIFLRYIDDIFFIWKGTEDDLKQFLNDINLIHPTIKFDYHTSKTAVNFLDLTIYKDINGKLATKVYTKPTDRQAFLHKNSAHPNHLKNSIPYGQALRLRRICSDKVDFEEGCNKLRTKLIERGYKEHEINLQIERVAKEKRDDLLHYKDKTPMTKIPFAVTYNSQLPNIKEAIDKHWDILKINPRLGQVFNEKPMIAFRKNKNLKDILEQKNIRTGKVERKLNIKNKKGWCRPCHSRNFNLCCQQVKNTNSFKSNQTNEEFKIFHQVSCKSKFVIYLIECVLCAIQYVGKSEWPMNIRLNKHRNDVFREEAIEVCQHFKQVSHDFNKNAKITIIEELKQHNNKSLKQKRSILEEREDFWIKRLKTLHPNGFNKELNRKE